MKTMLKILIVFVLSTQYANAASYYGHHDFVKVKLASARGGYAPEGENKYWVRIDGKGDSSPEQVSYYWHSIAIERCGFGSYAAEYNTYEKTVYHGSFSESVVNFSIKKTPYIEGILKCKKDTDAAQNSQKAFSVNLSHGNNVKDEQEFEKLREMVFSEIKERLSDKGIAVDMVMSNGKADLNIDINVKKFSYTGGVTRALFGVSAGRAVLEADVFVTDTASGMDIWSGEMAQVSSNLEGIHGDSTKSQVKALSYRVANILRRARSWYGCNEMRPGAAASSAQPCSSSPNLR